MSVYDDIAEEEKPELGEGLNKPTTVTLFGIFPKMDNPSDAEKRRYEARVSKNTTKIGELRFENTRSNMKRSGYELV